MHPTLDCTWSPRSILHALPFILIPPAKWQILKSKFCFVFKWYYLFNLKIKLVDLTDIHSQRLNQKFLTTTQDFFLFLSRIVFTLLITICVRKFNHDIHYYVFKSINRKNFRFSSKNNLASYPLLTKTKDSCISKGGKLMGFTSSMNKC